MENKGLMNEEQTKYDYINPALRAAGWGEVEGSHSLEFPITTGRIVGRLPNGENRRTSVIKADYALEYKNRRLAVIELKYNAIADAKIELGSIKSIRENFIGFQKNLYEDKASQSFTSP